MSTHDPDRATAIPDLEAGDGVVAQPVRWNPDGSFEEIREAASRSAMAPPPPNPFTELPTHPAPEALIATVAPEPFDPEPFPAPPVMWPDGGDH